MSWRPNLRHRVQRSVYRAGVRAARAGLPRTPPYDLDGVSGERFYRAWLRGFDAVATQSPKDSAAVQ